MRMRQLGKKWPRADHCRASAEPPERCRLHVITQLAKQEIPFVSQSNISLLDMKLKYILFRHLFVFPLIILYIAQYQIQ